MSEKPKTFHASAWCTELMEAMDLLRQNNMLCDTAIMASDGTVLMAHSVVLTACNNHMASIIKQVPDVVNLHYSAAAIEHLLSFVYMGQICVESDSLLTEVSKLATELQLGRLIDWISQAESSEEKPTSILQNVGEEPVIANMNSRIKVQDLDEGNNFTDIGHISDSTTDNYLTEKNSIINVIKVEDVHVESHPVDESSSWVNAKAEDCPLKDAESDTGSLSEVEPTEEASTTSDSDQILHADEEMIENDPTDSEGESSKDTMISKGSSTRRHPCETCGKILGTKQSLKMHQRVHTGEKPYKCKDCGKCFTQNQSLRIHIHRGHKIKKQHHCQLCNRFFKRESQLKVHQSTEHRLTSGEDIGYHCETCGKSLSSKLALEIHIRSHTGEKPNRCHECGRCFTQNGSLRFHIRSVHTGERPFKCRQCEKSFKFAYALHIHEGTVHAPDTELHPCSNCGKTFPNKFALKNHETRSHTKVKIYPCEHCGQVFKQLPSLNRHTQKHLGQSPGLVCDICGGVFSNLPRHKLTHIKDREKSFQCSYCTKLFYSKRSMVSHELVHTGERSHKCRHCDKAFFRAAQCNRHELTHSSERPFQCEICEKSFSKADTLRSHMQIHSDERNHKCPICGKGFKQREVLNTHVRIHGGPKQKTKTLLPSD